MNNLKYLIIKSGKKNMNWINILKKITTSSYANNDVLHFYREMPFNFGSTSAIEADEFIKQNIFTSSYTFLVPILESGGGGRTFLDVGCGTGLFAVSASFFYQCEATGIDFNERVIERAKDNASTLGLNCNFHILDLFLYNPVDKFDIVSCQGVLHHTNNCQAGVRKVLRDFVATGGYACVGLYHRFGRKPFLEYFSNLREKRKNEQELYDEYRKLNPHMKDEVRLQSWFRDQVLHPHETQHTLAEFINIIEDEHCRLISTSINRFEPIEDLNVLLAMEAGYEDIGRLRLAQGRYYPGYFVFLVQKI
jgi:SAM-dependent methyltransferase